MPTRRKTQKKGGCGCQLQQEQKGGKRKQRTMRRKKRVIKKKIRSSKKMMGGCGCQSQQGQRGGMFSGGGYLNPATYDPNVPRYDLNTHNSDPLNPSSQVAVRLEQPMMKGGGFFSDVSNLFKTTNPVAQFTTDPPVNPQDPNPTVKGQNGPPPIA